MSAEVQCCKLSKSFRGTVAVSDLDLIAPRGRILTLLGPSGCGKTTTLRLIAGFEVPDSGQTLIGGRVIASDCVFVPPEQRRVGVVFQNYALFPHMSVEANIAYGLQHQAVDRRKRIAEMLELTGLTGLEDRKPHQLSGGQQQRVALARALAPRPEILLLDEPFSNLDASLRTNVRAEVRSILRESGTTALFVTHDQEEALYLSDRIAVLNQGRLEQEGTAEELFHRPATRFTASFFGASSFIQAKVVTGGLDTELGLNPQSNEFAPGTCVDALIRPDDVKVHPDAQGAAWIERAQFRGMDMLYQVRLLSGSLVECYGPHHSPLREGERVDVELAPGHELKTYARLCAENYTEPEMKSSSAA